MDGGRDGRTDGRTDGQTDGYMDGWMGRQVWRAATTYACPTATRHDTCSQLHVGPIRPPPRGATRTGRPQNAA
eukprot:338041-Chlamydomonas_euryale.AAC.1